MDAGPFCYLDRFQAGQLTDITAIVLLATCQNIMQVCSSSNVLKYDFIPCGNCGIAWRHGNMETLSTLLALCVENQPVTDKFLADLEQK